MNCGIYKIINIKNNKFYLGSSKNLNKRWIQHKYKLRKNNHVNFILQKAWNKYGEGNIIFEVLEECDENKLFEREQYYLDLLKPKYNIGLKASGGDNLSNNPKRVDIIKRMSITNKEKYQKLAKEEKLKYSERYKGDKNPNFGNNWTDEMKESLRQKKLEYCKKNPPVNKGKKLKEIYGEEKAKEISDKISKFASSRTGEKNAFFNKHHTEEYKKNASDRRKGKYYGEQNIPFTINEKEYKSLGEASIELNIPITTIRWRLKSNNSKFSEYKYIPVPVAV